jgi:hypothetical protein
MFAKDNQKMEFLDISLTKVSSFHYAIHNPFFRWISWNTLLYTVVENQYKKSEKQKNKVHS